MLTLLATFDEDRQEDARARLVRHGHLPEREIVTGGGPVAVDTPSILPRYFRKAKSVEELLPRRYLTGASTGDFGEARAALLGPEAKGPSANPRLKAD